MIRTCVAVALLLSAATEAWAMLDTDIPLEAVDDAVMAGADEVEAMQDWAASLGGKAAGPLLLKNDATFSFAYDGKPSAELLKGWKRTAEIEGPARPHRASRSVDRSATGLQVLLVAGAFKRFPAVDWVVYLENRGDKDTPIIEGIQALDRLFGGADRRTGDRPASSERRQRRRDRVSAEGRRRSSRASRCGSHPTAAGPPPPARSRSSTSSTARRGRSSRSAGSGQWAASFERSAAGSTRIARRHGEDAPAPASRRDGSARRASCSCRGRATARRLTTAFAV